MAWKQLSDVTEQYLNDYACIRNRMIQEMTEAQLTDSLSHNFIVQMIPHHQAAIDMSENLLRYTTCLPLQDMAQSIITEQSQGICEMERMLPACAKQENTDAELCAYAKNFRCITDRMFVGMEHAPEENDINRDFITEMLPHHMGAVRMSKNALSFPICRELVPVLKSIIRTQEEGIRQMQKLLRYSAC